MEETRQTDLELVEPRYTHRPGKIDVGRALKMRIQGYEYKDIAKFFGTGKQAIHQALKVFRGIMPLPDQIRAFRAEEAELLDGARLTLMRLTIDQAEELKTRKAYELGMLYCAFFDKQRLLRGQSTANVSTLTAVVEAATARNVANFRKLEVGLTEDSKPPPEAIIHNSEVEEKPVEKSGS